MCVFVRQFVYVCVHAAFLPSCLFEFLAEMPRSMTAQTVQSGSITHLLLSSPRPLRRLVGIKYHSLVLRHCQTQFQSFSSAKSSCIFYGSDSRSRCGRETEPGRSRRDWQISTSQCSVSLCLSFPPPEKHGTCRPPACKEEANRFLN